MNIEEIRNRHEADECVGPLLHSWDEQTHKDRAELLKLVEKESVMRELQRLCRGLIIYSSVVTLALIVVLMFT